MRRNKRGVFAWLGGQELVEIPREIYMARFRQLVKLKGFQNSYMSALLGYASFLGEM